ncbi:hypothetical protein LTR36_009753 [Oleoguttula mirabilis]|uniref:Uncharacterized protein n=1 Tax=Oleoguttula mirabilis TaxID=1507867 RepID=A0AAV9J5W7_9PEZI|nr:hypothetical protein LTR36_009753 [Oleoguttula mirabilis]
MAYSPIRGRTTLPREVIGGGPGAQQQASPSSFPLSALSQPHPQVDDVFGGGIEQQQHHHHPPVSPLMSRSASVASDRYSVVSGLTSTTHWAGKPQNVNPAPSYVAPTGAAQVVGEHRGAGTTPGQRHSSSDDDEAGGLKSKDDVQFSGPALELINAFLDQLLFSFLSTARSTSLHALRPAVTEVLKARLARDAIASAEEELQELLAGGEEEEEENTKLNAAESNRRWDLELVWKRTRLRVMVYMRLGEMEDEDEERYIKEEELFHGNERRFSQTSGLVSWAAAIFLTGVLEYVAEQTLQIAGNAAYTRARRQSRNARTSTPTLEERQQQQQQTPVTVEDYDVEKVALNSTVGRLWRTWRKSLRNTAAAPSTPTHRFSRMSGEGFYSAMSQRRGSVGNGTEGSVNGDAHPQRNVLDDVPEMRFPEHVLASNIPLPLGDRQRDVDEIEVPGLARDPDAHEGKEGSVTPTARRNSFTSPLAYSATGGLPTPDSLGPAEQGLPSERPAFNRQRSMSVPTPVRTPITAEQIKHTPGAFPDEAVDESAETLPEEGQEEQQQQLPGAEDKEEQKASAQEMAPHRRASQDVKGLLDKVVNHEPAEENAEQKDKSEHHGLIGGAIAGATAVAGATAAMVYGSSKGGDNGVAEDDHAVETGNARASEADMPAEESNKGISEVGRPAEDSKKNISKVDRPAEDGRDVEARDNRKSLLDMKTLIGPGPSAVQNQDAPEIMTSRQVSVSQPETPPMMIRNGSDESHKSEVLKDPYKLGDKRGQEIPQQSPAKRQHMPRAMVTPDQTGSDENEYENGIGVARTSDVMVESPVVNEQQARGSAKRPSRLVLGGATLTGRNSILVESPTFKKTASPKSRDFLESRSLTSMTERPEFAEMGRQAPSSAHVRAEPIQQVPHKRRSIPGLAFTSAAATPTVERNAHRQSWSAAAQQQRELDGGAASRPLSVPSVPTVPAALRQGAKTESSVHEHPVVQRMASLKRNQRKSDPSMDGGGRDGSLTSASIRGPEDFDSFVQGADTVKYTLTPQNVRDAPVQNMSHARRAPPPAELSSAPSVSRRSAGPPIDTSDARTGRSAVSKQATSAIPDRNRNSSGGATEREAEQKQERRRSTSKPPPRNTSTSSRSGLMAREPQIMTESTRDFADFIRSTGPNKEQKVLPVINPANRSTTSLHSLRSAHTNGAASRSSSLVSQDRSGGEPGRERAKSLSQSVMTKENIPPVPPVPVKGSSSSRRNMQTRTPTGAGDGNSDFIDFIRSGPGEDGQHRISRSVAPFRSTMDSDQLQDMGDRIRGDGPPMDLRLNTNVNGAPSLQSAKSPASMRPPSSVRASANTRAGAVLASNATTGVHPAHSGQPQRLATTTDPSAPGGSSTLSPIAGGAAPLRKRHRNKDPYAIDMDDEDDDLLTALPKNRRPEESLMDFLSNTEPPTDNAPRPLVNGGGAQARSVMNKARANSISSLRSAGARPAESTTPQAHASRAKSIQSPVTSAPRPSSVRSVQSNSSAPRAPGNRPYSQATAGAPPIPVSSRAKMEARSPGEPKPAPPTKPSTGEQQKVTAPGPPGVGGPGAGAGNSRDTFGKQSNTKDLADFFKNSGPPDDDRSAPAPVVGRQSKLSAKDAEKARKKAEKDGLRALQDQKKKKGGGFFGRLTGRRQTWLNMP